MVKTSISFFGPSPPPPHSAHGSLVQFSHVLHQHKELEQCYSLHFVHFSGGLEPGKQLSLLIFSFFWEVGGCFHVSICVLRTKGCESVTLLLAPSPLLSDLHVWPVWACDRWLLSLCQRSSPDTPVFPRQSSNWTQRLALAHLHVQMNFPS